VPFGPGSVAVLLTPHEGTASEVAQELLDQARLAETAGFDGALAGEHHAGFPGYLPNPLQAAGWFLDVTSRLWSAPCPLLLPLRPTRLVAEDAAWLAARFPGRVGLGVAVGAAEVDFAVASVPHDERASRYRLALPELVRILRGDPGALAGDVAVEACAASHIPVVSATTTVRGVRLAAAAGAGIMLDGFSPLTWSRGLADQYRAVGGDGPIVLSRRAWLGEPPTEIASADRERYAAFTPDSVRNRIAADDTLIADADPSVVVAALRGAVAATGADVLSLRLHLPGIGPETARDQIARFGREVLPGLRLQDA
jgi:alkanesulfonate monooxygenase SsuD/methylene tetrahydromethanopterin reductase-like flavin-dependent oxidoreductase (luciferase family)